MSPTRRIFIDVAAASRLDIDANAMRVIERKFDDAASTDRTLATMIAVGVVVMIAAGWAIGFGLIWSFETIGMAKGAAIAIAAVATPLVLIGAWFAIFPRITRRRFRRTLRECGHDVCERCGYLLDGLEVNARRPECGLAEQPPLGETPGS